MRAEGMEANRPKTLDLHCFQRDISRAQSANEPLSPVSELVTSVTETNIAAKGNGTLQRRSTDPLELCIFLPNRQGIQFTVAEGRYANAEQLTSLLWAEMELEKETAQKTLSLWMCSPLLSIQLKEHHVPFKLRKIWPHLLRRYASASEEQIFQDEPLLMVRRNVMMAIEQEIEAKDTRKTRCDKHKHFEYAQGPGAFRRRIGSILFCLFHRLPLNYIQFSIPSLKTSQRHELVLKGSSLVEYSQYVEDIHKLEGDEKLLELLYLDAKEYTLSGCRPLPIDHYLRLAAIQMAIELGPFDPKIHTLSFIRDAAEDFFPDHVLPSVRGWSLFGWTISGCAGAEAAIMELYEEVSDLSKSELRKRYLRLSRQHPGYGSAVFFGQIEQRGRWWRARHFPVIVTINLRWICIIDLTSRVPLLTINIATTKWCSVEGIEDNDPLLALLFPLDDEKTQLNSMVAVASKQASLMVALLDSVATAQEGQSNSGTHLHEMFEKFFESRTDLVVSALFDVHDGVCLEMPEGLKLRFMQNADRIHELNDYRLEPYTV